MLKWLLTLTVMFGFPDNISTITGILETQCNPSKVYYLHHDYNYDHFQVWKTHLADSCKKHHFCPDWFLPGDFLKEIPCGYGFYNELRNSTSPDDCLPCPAGKYCFAGIFDCPRGYYCMENALPKEPWPGFHAPTTGLTEPVPCSPGFYQPVLQHRKWEWQGIFICLTCPKGRFCDVSKLAAPAGHCDDGWECGRGETSPRPIGKQCSQGHYCSKGTKYECKKGYYQPGEGMHFCLECPEGKYCETKGLAFPTGLCASGFDCGYKSISASANGCPAGHMCPNGIKEPCGDGHYQANANQDTCDRCPIGQYCSGTALTSVTGSCSALCCSEDGQAVPDACPPAQPTSCTRGYYEEDGACKICPAGKYCSIAGLSAPSGSCTPSWYCDEGEVVPAPPGKYCPAGHKCPAGIKVQCGKENDRYYYQPNRGQTKCLLCADGFNCVGPGLGQLTDLCAPGYECRDGLIMNCPVGSYCNGGKRYTCREGFKTTEKRQSICVRCDPGFHCKDGVQLTCPVNRVCYNGLANYCELGFTCSIVDGELVKTPCAPGTERYELESDTCVPCRQFRYCRSATSHEGFRHIEGAACIGGASTPFQNISQPGQHYEFYYENYEKNRGYIIKDCTPGTYQPNTHRKKCLPCRAGYYCSTAGLSAPTAICPAQFKCPEGSSDPVSCPEDQPLEGQSEC